MKLQSHLRSLNQFRSQLLRPLLRSSRRSQLVFKVVKQTITTDPKARTVEISLRPDRPSMKVQGPPSGDSHINYLFGGSEDGNLKNKDLWQRKQYVSVITIPFFPLPQFTIINTIGDVLTYYLLTIADRSSSTYLALFSITLASPLYTALP